MSYCVQALHSFDFSFFWILVLLLYNGIPGLFGVDFWVRVAWFLVFGILL
jgi:hypothetical protein